LRALYGARPPFAALGDAPGGCAPTRVIAAAWNQVIRLWVLQPTQERTMKSLALAIGMLSLVLAASSTARADYAVVQFDDGYCRIWWDSVDTPWGVGWTKIAVGLPDNLAAQAALDNAIAQQVCH
jgi:hypothetical protein